MHLADERPAGEIAVDDEFKDVVVQAGLCEIPVVVVGFVQKVELVEPLDPADLDRHIQVLRVVLVADSRDRLAELFGANRVGVGDDRPVTGVTVNSGDLVGRKLEDLEFHVRAFESDSQAGQQKECWCHRVSPSRVEAVGHARRIVGVASRQDNPVRRNRHLYDVWECLERGNK